MQGSVGDGVDRPPEAAICSQPIFGDEGRAERKCCDCSARPIWGRAEAWNASQCASCARRPFAVALHSLSFFEPIPSPPERRDPGRQSPWFSPPENEFGVSVPIRLVLTQIDELALALVDVVAYSTGFALRLALRVPPGAAGLDQRGFMIHPGPMGSSEEQFRFGVRFADGRKATNLGPWPPPGNAPPAISLVQRGGGGGRGWDLGYWVYPLPPPGPVTVAFVWPRGQLAEQSREFDATPIIEAAAASDQLWEDNRPFGPGSASAVAFTSMSSTRQIVRAAESASSGNERE